MEQVVLFWFTLALNGAREAHFSQEVEDLPACELEAREFMRKPPYALLLRGGKLTAGCQVVFTASVEH